MKILNDSYMKMKEETTKKEKELIDKNHELL